MLSFPRTSRIAVSLVSLVGGLVVCCATIAVPVVRRGTIVDCRVAQIGKWPEGCLVVWLAGDVRELLEAGAVVQLESARTGVRQAATVLCVESELRWRDRSTERGSGSPVAVSRGEQPLTAVVVLPSRDRELSDAAVMDVDARSASVVIAVPIWYLMRLT